jgi:hypothetical protein
LRKSAAPSRVNPGITWIWNYGSFRVRFCRQYRQANIWMSRELFCFGKLAATTVYMMRNAFLISRPGVRPPVPAP